MWRRIIAVIIVLIIILPMILSKVISTCFNFLDSILYITAAKIVQWSRYDK